MAAHSHALVAQHVDQVDQHRSGDEPHSPVKWMDQWEHKISGGRGQWQE